MIAIIILLSVGSIICLLIAIGIAKYCIYEGWDRGIPLTFFVLLTMALATCAVHLYVRSLPEPAPTKNTNFNQLP